jgi:hypothetical protein
MKNKIIPSIVLLILPVFLLATSPACEEKTKSTNAATGNPQMTRPGKSVHDPVAMVWQKKFFLDIETSKSEEGFALFTSGGWADQGQYLILLKDGKATYKRVNPGSKKINSTKLLSQSRFSNLNGLFTESSSLGDIDIKAMDGLVYEYVHVKNSEGTVRAVKRIYINNPDMQKMPKHQSLIDSFKNLEKLEK